MRDKDSLSGARHAAMVCSYKLCNVFAESTSSSPACQLQAFRNFTNTLIFYPLDQHFVCIQPDLDADISVSETDFQIYRLSSKYMFIESSIRALQMVSIRSRNSRRPKADPMRCNHEYNLRCNYGSSRLSRIDPYGKQSPGDQLMCNPAASEHAQLYGLWIADLI